MKKETEMKKIVLMSSLLFSTVMADELVEPLQEQVTAVSKVMERFSKLSTIESIPIEDVIEEKALEETRITQEKNLEQLESAQTIQTAKFESKDIPYPKDKEVTTETVQITEPEKIAPTKEKSLKEIEAHARKVIEEEIKKVEKAKTSALERINQAMKQLERAKSS